MSDYRFIELTRHDGFKQTFSIEDIRRVVPKPSGGVAIWLHSQEKDWDFIDGYDDVTSAIGTYRAPKDDAGGSTDVTYS